MEEINIFAKDDIQKDSLLSTVTMPWVEKYRPKTIDDMVLKEETKLFFKNMVASNDISNMTLFGSPGIGKSSLAKLLAKTVNAETLFIPCGTDGTVDVVRSRIQPFCESASSERIKCIILDEFDSASGSSASSNGMQKSLRSLMETYSDTRFIITCNYPKKIIEPIFSRCPKIHIGFDQKDIAMRLKYIWECEGIKYDKDTANKFFSEFVKPRIPDIRSIIQLTQNFCRSGELVISYSDNKNNDGISVIQRFADAVIMAIASNNKILDIIKSIHSSVSKFDGDYEKLISVMAESIIKFNLNPDAIVVLAECAYKMSQVVDPSLQIEGSLVHLRKLIGHTK